MSLGGSGFGRAGGVFGRAALLGFRGWCRLRICRVLVSRMEIEKGFAMTKVYQDILYVNDIKQSVCGFESQSLIITLVAISILLSYLWRVT